MLIIACNAGASQDLPVYYDFPAFSLTDQMGRTVTRDDMEGRVVLANFIFTNCTEYCLVLTPRMQQMQARLEDEGNLGNDVLLLSFSVDPEHDTPELLRTYAESYGANHDAWRFLTGPQDEVYQVITDGLKLAYGEVEQRTEHTHEDGSVHVHEYDVFHTSRVVLADREGMVRAYYDGALDWDAEAVLKDIRSLLNP